MTLWSGLKSLIIPIECVSCGASNIIICTSCRTQLLDSPEAQPVLLSTRPPFKLASQLPFNDVVSRIVLGAKDDGNADLERVLVDSLTRTRALFSSELILIPIPGTTRARQARGRDFLFDVCQSIAKVTGDLVLPILTLGRKVAPQKKLNAHERLMNMQGALRIREDLKVKFHDAHPRHELLLVDDVLTTGATMREGFRALTAGGAWCVGGISAAYSPNWRRGRLAH